LQRDAPELIGRLDRTMPLAPAVEERLESGVVRAVFRPAGACRRRAALVERRRRARAYTARVIESPQLSVMGGRSMGKPSTPDLALLDDVVAKKVLDAMRTASKLMRGLGIRHALVGGLAVGAHGYPRATKDVDFLVGAEAFEMHEGGIVTLRPGLPVQIQGVLIDHLSASAREQHLGDCLEAQPAGEIVVAPVEVLVYLKLRSSRQKDLADVVELVKVGIDAQACRAYLQRHAPDLIGRLDRAVLLAAAEER
jgi:hypothetical protein